MKGKAFPNNEYSILSAEIEIKLLIKNEEFKNYIKTTEIESDETEQKQYDEILFKQIIIRALRTELNL